MTQTHAASHPYSHSAVLTRLLLAVVLAVVEMLVTSWLFVLDLLLPAWRTPQFYIRELALLCVASAIAFAVVNWPKHHVLLESMMAHTRSGSWRVPLVVNLVLFAILTIATVEFSRFAATADTIPWIVYAAYLVPLVATGVSLMWLAAPVGVWRLLVTDYRMEIGLSAGAGLVALWAGALARSGWDQLAWLTLKLSYGILLLYESSVRVDFARRVIGVGNFEVYIDAACSGYEGIGLVIVFMALFLWVFRSSLRFPNAFLLLPIGIAAIWLLNSVRIAALVSIGAHVSPQIAVDGFHSQAGWMAFLCVTIGMMMTAPRLAFFAAGGTSATRHGTASDRVILAFLAPFMCLMAAGIVVAASAPYDAWLYGLKVASVGLCLWIFRDVYLGLVAKVDPVALAAGAIVGILWVATAPAGEGESTVGAWIATQPVWLAALWLVLRAVGAIIMVPIAEELAFRGLLHRWLISRRFETVEFAAFSWLAFIASSLLFGLMHQRWLAGTLAGAAFALTMYRSGRLSDPIAAHMVANAIVIACAIAAQNWALL